jgi:hypothetical protein
MKPSQLIPQFFVYTFNRLRLNPETDRIVEFSPTDRKVLDFSTEQYTVTDLRNGILPSLLPTATSQTYVYFNRVIERLMDPLHVLECIRKHFPTGCIEMTSPLVSSVRSVPDSPFRGNPLNHHILWSHEGVLHVLPKFPVFPVLEIKKEFEEETRKVLAERPHYQTIFYTWDEEHPFEYIIHPIEDLSHMNGYHLRYTQAIEQCVPATNAFYVSILERLNNEDSTVKQDNDES